jgi:hypothetical protein
MAVSSAGLRPKSDCSGKAQKQFYSNLETRSLVREAATKLQTRNYLKEISRERKIGHRSQMGARHQDRLDN